MTAGRCLGYSLTLLLLAAAGTAIAQPPASPGHALLEQAERAKLASDLDEALRLYSAAIAAGDLDRPALTRAHIERGGVQAHKGDNTKAIRDFSAAIALDPDFGSAYVLRGYAYALQGRFELAKQDYDVAIRLAPGQRVGYLSWVSTHVAEALRRQGRLEAALAAARSAAKMKGARPAVHFRIALVLLDAGRVEDARREYRLFENGMRAKKLSYDEFWPDELESMRRLRAL